MLWYRADTVEAWVDLPACERQRPVVASFEVSGGEEYENAALALELGRALVERFNPDARATALAECPDLDSPDPDTPNAVHTVWYYCPDSAAGVERLVPVKTVFQSGRPDRSSHSSRPRRPSGGSA
ncbi:MAG: hypothetical protein R2695_08950 [Acidimicrobiales bacterium]